MKRFAADRVNLEDIPLPIIEDKPEKIAVIGSGPAGLTSAYYLRLKGYQVTIFEALPVLGGLLRTAIPEQKLPRDVLDNEIKNLLRLGIPVETGKRLGTDFTLDDLRQEGFKAFFIGIGAKGTSKLNVPGIETGRRGRIAVDDSTMRTSAPDVFAAGDAASGVASVIEAVALAHIAVQTIDLYLRGEIRPSPSTGEEDTKTLPKIEIDRSYLKAAKGSLVEAVPGMTEDAARAEAARCLNCSTCAECMECVRACERSAIDHSMRGEDREIQVGSIILATGFDTMDPTAAQKLRVWAPGRSLYRPRVRKG